MALHRPNFENLAGDLISSLTGIQSDFHYSIIWLLLNSANNPTLDRETILLRQQDTKEPADEETIDWPKYLMEGEYRPNIHLHIDRDIVNDDATVRFSDEVDKDKINSEAQETSQSAVAERLNLLDNVTSQLVQAYWNCTPDPKQIRNRIKTSHCRDCTLAFEWDEYIASKLQLYRPHTKVVVTEYQVVRETLWMLRGVRKLFVYKFCDGYFDVNPDMEVSHLTPVSLINILRHFAKIANIRAKVSNFIESITMKRDKNLNLTYHAFAATLTEFLKTFDNNILTIERRILNQDIDVSLLKLSSKLHVETTLIHTLNALFEEGLDISNKEDSGVSQISPSNALRTSHLLSSLYNALIYFDNMGDSGLKLVSLLLPIIHDTVRPYIKIIEKWITTGELNDPTEEFFIVRDRAVKVNDAKFWFTALSVRSDSNSGDSSFSENWVPAFLQNIVNQMLLMGKSTELIYAIIHAGMLSSNRKSRFLKAIESESLYSLFSKTIKKELIVTSDRQKDEINSSDNNAVCVWNSLQTNDILRTVESNNLLELNFYETLNVRLPQRNLGNSSANFGSAFNWEISSDSKLLHEPFEKLFHRCLVSHISSRYKVACRHLLDILRDDCKLFSHLENIRKLYLMEAGDAMHSFYSNIFEKIQKGNDWKDVSYLDTILNEAVQIIPSKQSFSLLTIKINHSEKPSLAIETLSCLDLQYEVAWPLDIVIDSFAMDYYNKIFRFLLQIKWALWQLEDLSFGDLVRPNLDESDIEAEEKSSDYLTPSDDIEKSSLLHQMHILRFKLIHFVNALHQYMMSKVLYSSGIEFQDRLEKASDLDEIIEIHKRYIKTLHDRCLLTDRVRIVRETIAKILNIAIMFCRQWDKGIADIRQDERFILSRSFNYNY
ncbi:Gamma-tubulin complex component 5 [Trichoplax sp. H2]|nr:Gamma-tubulin complex component 5 [Trichoplax sp. H2]|eukprot:RDD38403.1 Gamma-tubulin complex component 5 [Trichoplax sp. H2]